MTEHLRGKRVLVTGASSGIGAAIADLLTAEGAAVALHYAERADVVKQTVARVTAAGGRAVAIQTDLRDERAWKRIVGEAVDALGGLDGLVNNAGRILQPLSIADMTRQAWDENFTLNATAPFFVARDAFAYMQSHGGGRIVNVSSIGVKFGGSPTSQHYSAAKRALEGVTVGLAKLGAPHGVLVNAVRAGIIDTPLHAGKGANEMDDRRRLIPLKRFGTATEVARMVVFLLGPGGDFITGQILAVSGGE